MLVAPYVCWRMEAASRFTVGWEELGDLVEEACRHWAGREKPAGSSRTLARMLRWLDGKDPYDLAEDLRDVLAGEVALFVESGDAYSLPHQSFRDCLAAIHLKNAMEAPFDELPVEFGRSISVYVKDFLADLCDDGALGVLWETNRVKLPTDTTATHNLLRVIHRKRDGDLTALDWSGMDLSGVNLYEFRGADMRVRLSDRPASFLNTKVTVDCFLPQGHGGAINALSFSPDGKLIASGSSDGSVCLWDARTYKRVGASLVAHEGGVTALCFCGDGTRLLSVSLNRALVLWDVADQHKIGKTIKGGTGGIRSVCADNGGDLVIIGSYDGVVYVWDTTRTTATRREVARLCGPVVSVAISKDDRRVIAASSDGTLVSLDPRADGPTHTLLRLAEGRDAPLALSSDGSMVARCGDETTQVWDTDTGDLIAVVGARVTARYIGFGDDGVKVFTGSSTGDVGAWDIRATGSSEQTLLRLGSRIRSLCMSPDGSYVAGGLRDGTIRIWDVVLGTQVGEIASRQPRWATSVCLSEDGLHAAVGLDDGSVRLISSDNGYQVKRPLVGHTGWVTSVCFNPKGGTLVSASSDRTVRLWDSNSGVQIGGELVGHKGPVRSVCFSPAGGLVASASDDGAIVLWDVGEHRRIGLPLVGHKSSVRSLCFSEDGRYIVSGSDDRTIRMWDVRKCEQIGKAIVGHDGPVRSVYFGQIGGSWLLASGSKDQTVRVWEVGEEGGKLELLWQRRVGAVRSVCLGPKDEVLFAGLDNGTVRTLRVSDGAQVGPHLKCRAGRVTSVCVKPDCSRLFAATSSGKIRAWDIRPSLSDGHVPAPSKVSQYGAARLVFGADLYGLDLRFSIIPESDKVTLRCNGAIVG